MIIFMFFTIFTSCQLAARRGVEGRPKGGRSGERGDHDNRRRPNSLGKQNHSVCRCCCCCYSRAAAAAAANDDDDEMLPPSYDNNNVARGSTTRQRRRRPRQRQRCRRATCGIHGLHYTRVRFVLCDVDFFTTSIKLNP